jgi:DNA/RNA endonuclease YhcR with UshA esterase domain
MSMKATFSFARAARVLALLAGTAALGACEPDPSPPFQVPATGGIEALLFFDNDQDNLFDPADGDFALSGVQVEVRARGTTQVLAGGAITADAQGRFTLANLPAGTHDVYIVPTSVPAQVKICQNPVQVTVNPGETRFLQVQTRGACLILIADAKKLPAGTPIVLRGTVVAPQGVYRTDNAYIQDRSGGAQIFGVNPSFALVVGDSVEVTGVAGAFSGEFEVLNIVSVTKLGTGTVPAPKEPTPAELAARTFEGQLVKANNVTVVSVDAPAASGAYNVNVTYQGAPLIVRVEALASAAIPTSRWVAGSVYDVTGALGSFSGTPQLKPRTAADVTNG